MKAIWLAALGTGLVGCLGLQLGNSSGSGGAAAASGTGGTTTTGAAAQGAECGVDPETGTTLCLAISICPTLTIDQSVFPACGFRVLGSAIDLECSCAGQLCPIGVAATCTDAATLLAQQNEGVVCNQVSEGRCVQGTPVASTTTAGSSSSCDPGCRDMCVDDPACLQACGC